MKVTSRDRAGELLHRFSPFVIQLVDRLLWRGCAQSGVITLLHVTDTLGGALAEAVVGDGYDVPDTAFIIGAHPQKIELVLTLQFAGYAEAANALQKAEGLAVVVVDAGYAEVFDYAHSVAN